MRASMNAGRAASQQTMCSIGQLASNHTTPTTPTTPTVMNSFEQEPLARQTSITEQHMPTATTTTTIRQTSALSNRSSQQSCLGVVRCIGHNQQIGAQTLASLKSNTNESPAHNSNHQLQAHYYHPSENVTNYDHGLHQVSSNLNVSAEVLNHDDRSQNINLANCTTSLGNNMTDYAYEHQSASQFYHQATTDTGASFYGVTGSTSSQNYQPISAGSWQSSFFHTPSNGDGATRSQHSEQFVQNYNNYLDYHIMSNNQQHQQHHHQHQHQRQHQRQHQHQHQHQHQQHQHHQISHRNDIPSHYGSQEQNLTSRFASHHQIGPKYSNQNPVANMSNQQQAHQQLSVQLNNVNEQTARFGPFEAVGQYQLDASSSSCMTNSKQLYSHHDKQIFPLFNNSIDTWPINDRQTEVYLSTTSNTCSLLSSASGQTSSSSLSGPSRSTVQFCELHQADDQFVADCQLPTEYVNQLNRPTTFTSGLEATSSFTSGIKSQDITNRPARKIIGSVAATISKMTATPEAVITATPATTTPTTTTPTTTMSKKSPQMGKGQPAKLNGTSSNSSQRLNQCNVCGRNYARPSTLKTHLRTHTNERPFRCDICQKTFSQAANLTAHQRVHTGERPFSCPVCGRHFSQSSSVITHLRTHSGERPYRCSKCNRTFSDSSTLTKHCRIHSGEKPYQCEYCPLNFSQSGNLSRHLKLHLLAVAAAANGCPRAKVATSTSSASSSGSSSSLSSSSVSSNSPIRTSSTVLGPVKSERSALNNDTGAANSCATQQLGHIRDPTKTPAERQAHFESIETSSTATQ